MAQPPGYFPPSDSNSTPNEPPPPYSPPRQYPPPPNQNISYAQNYSPSSYHSQHVPGAPGVYYPPPAPGQYPPPGVPGAYPVQYHVATPPPSSIGPHGYDTVDSDNEDIVCTKDNRHPMVVTFMNKTGKKISLYWIDEDGNDKKITSIKANDRQSIDTWETHPFFAESTNEVLINGNFVFIPQKLPGGHNTLKVELTKAPTDAYQLRSPLAGFPVTLKFSNRTKYFVSIKWINADGGSQVIKDIAPEKAWMFHSCEGHYFTACKRGEEKSQLQLNRGWFYFVRRGPNPKFVTKVLITDNSVAGLDSGSSIDL